MAEKTCKTCRFWQSSKECHIEAQKVCRAPSTHFTTILVVEETLDNVLIDTNTRQELESTEVGVLDGSGYWGELMTGPDFGCVNYERN